MNQKLPIKDVVELIQLGAAVSVAVENAKKDDGKIDLRDLPHLLPVIPFIGPAVENVDQVLKQLGDVDDEEFAKLSGELAKISIIGSKPEVLAVVSAVLSALKANYEAYKAIQALKAA